MGTQLYDILADEDSNKVWQSNVAHINKLCVHFKQNQRQQVLSKQIVIEQVESTMRQSIQQLQEEMTSMQDRKENLDQDSEDLNSKIEKKFAELSRNRKRLQTLNAQRLVNIYCK